MATEDVNVNNAGAEVNSPKAEEAFDTTGLLLDFLSHWKWFLLSVVVCVACGAYYIATVIPTYDIAASLYLRQDNEKMMNALSMSSDDPMIAMKNFIDETELEVLKSRNNLVKIVDSLNLAYKYYSKGRFRDYPLYEDNAIVASLDSISLRSLKSPIYVEVSNGSDGKFNVEVRTIFDKIEENKELEDVELPVDIELSQGTLTLSMSPAAKELNGVEKIVINNPRVIAAQISSSLTLAFPKNSSSIVRINLLSQLPKEGIDIINTLIDFYNQQIIDDKNRSAVQTEAFILDRLVMISDELKDVENRLKEYRQAHNITDIQAQASLNLSLQSDYESQVAKVDADLRILDEIERVVSSADTYETVPSAVDDQTLTTFLEAYNRKILQLNRTLEGSTPDNPLVVRMQEEIGRDKVRLIQNIAASKRSMNTRRNSLMSLENRSAGQLASQPSIDKGLQEIFREQQVKVNIYTFLLQKREEIALQKTLATNTARLIDDPVAAAPVSPKKMSILMVAFVLGLLIPGLVIFVRRLLFPVFKDQDELERLTDLPIIGEICKDPDVADKQKVIVIGENVSTPAAELFRLLRNNISFTRSGQDKKVILVTSSISGEGKTFVAVNLAMTYALTGKKVAVVGMDIRRPALAHRFGLSNRYGVTTFLSGQEHDVMKLVHQSEQNKNLFILTAGPVAPNPNELFLSPGMDDLIRQLKDNFDLVIIDSAPIGLISDTFLITKHSDIQLYVTRAGFSTKRCLKMLHHAASLNKFSSVYIVLNGVDMGASTYIYRRYGYGRYGSKKMTYGYGYQSKDRKSKSSAGSGN